MDSEQTINLRPPMWLPIVVVLIGGAFYIAGKNIDRNISVPPGTITVTGEGKVSVAPDIAQVSFGVDTGKQPTASAAMKILSNKMNAIFDAVQKAGIDKKDISTQNLSLNPVYDWQNGTQTVLGFQATESLQAKVRDMDKTSDVVTAATVAGANQVGGVNFTVDDPTKAQADARQKAIDQAKQKATVLAQQLGVRLGAIKQFSEGGGTMPPIMYERSAVMGMGGGADTKSIPLPSGQQDVTVDVSITYELE